MTEQCHTCGCLTGSQHGRVEVEDAILCRHCASVYCPPKPPKPEPKRKFTPGEYDMPWDDWDAFMVRAVERLKGFNFALWGTWGRILTVLVVLICYACLSPKARTNDNVRCEIRHERWVLKVDQHRRDHAYDGMKRCRKAEDKMRAAYFAKYLADTMGDK